MYAFQRYIFQCPQANDAGQTSISEDPLSRFGIKSPEVFHLQVLSCVFSAYHALKSEIRAGKIVLHRSGWLNASWSVFAQTLLAEAGELHLNIGSFALLQFMQFILTGGTNSPAISMRSSHQHEDD